MLKVGVFLTMQDVKAVFLTMQDVKGLGNNKQQDQKWPFELVTSFTLQRQDLAMLAFLENYTQEQKVSY